jgi:phosphohistidine phosphatase
MNLYFIRHAEAGNKTIGIDDSERELTKKGIEQISKAVKGWKFFIDSFDIIVTSPYKRAVQTAKIVSKGYELKGIFTDKRLEPGCRAEDIILIINEMKNENIALVGHEPDFSNSISSMISNSGATIDMKKGGIAKVSFPSKPRISGGVLEFLIPPKVFIYPKE